MWEEAEEFLAKDKYLGQIVITHGSCTIKPRKRKYYFEDLVDAIIQQQLSISAAESIFERIKSKLAGSSKNKINHRWRESSTLDVKIYPEVFPVGDLGLRNAFNKLFKKDFEKDEMIEFAQRWKPFRTVAGWYIWKSLEDLT